MSTLSQKPRDPGKRVFYSRAGDRDGHSLELNSAMAFSLLRMDLMIPAFPLPAVRPPARPKEREVQL